MKYFNNFALQFFLLLYYRTHMNNELFPKLKELERYCKEDFLVSLTNKGIYNRALKDFEKIKDTINLKLDDNNIKISFEDVEVIFKNDEIKNSLCSCPSKTICKHVIIAILYIKDYLSKIDYNSEEEESFNKNNFNYIINISADELKKLSSKKNFEYALDIFKNTPEINIKEDNILEIKLKEAVIYFEKNSRIEKSICSICKDNNLCYHKIAAILKYKEFYNNLEEIKEEYKQIDYNLISFSKMFVEDIFKKGIYSCNENDFDKAEYIATQLLIKDIPSLSKLFRSVANGIDAMINKKAYFNKLLMFNTIAKIYNLIRYIETSDNETLNKLIGEKRSKYVENRYSEFIGIGAYPFVLSSGYMGSTSYVYNLNNKEIYSVSNIMPTFYESNNNFSIYDNIKSNYTKKNINNLSIEDLSKNKSGIENFRTNNDNKISLNKSTNFQLKERVNFKFIDSIKKDLEDIFIESYEDIKNISFDYDYFFNRENYKIIITEFERIENISFDKINQIFYFDILNSKKETLTLDIKYNNINKHGVKFIKDYKNSKIDKDKFIVLKKSNFATKPISIININAVINIYF